MSCPKCNELDGACERNWSEEKGFRNIYICENENCNIRYERITEMTSTYKLLEDD